ncbi:MAG: hypothetical protein A3G91_02420 [Omnitrophica WOR_2 bacterium RIFCSPLOWO2_12_FULL_50_9]|nr:MAG: hypothetical protein A3D87_06810 [Omnitrophica WOR_2 bacterium RIFCSPHIGHO2_02_FULL_50_17]OGX43641.1 MAG: hypothetical protein A3G91_02420 [Omnitrophica WOR_2 bacterium RIFCSPLOWO2_12_FULL_50_9]
MCRRQGINIYPFLRILTGLLFMTSGFEKVISPHQNFLYVIQSYAFLNPLLEEMAAHLLPWCEFFIGIFLVLGLWLNRSLLGLAFLLVMFLEAVAQAILRHLPIEECGCFGGLMSFPLPSVLVFDTALFILTGLMYYKIEKTQRFSLDQYLFKNEAP